MAPPFQAIKTPWYVRFCLGRRPLSNHFQAPASPNQKRKRGRQRDASGTANDAPARGSGSRRTAADRGEEDLNDPTHPRKRRQHPTADVILEDSASAAKKTANMPAPSRKTKDRQEETTEHTDAQDKDGGAPPRRSRRDRHSGDGTPWWTVSGTPSTLKPSAKQADGASVEKRKRGRPSLQEVPVDDAQNRVSSGSADVGSKKRRRPSLPAEPLGEGADPGPRRKRGRPSLSNERLDEGVNPAPKKKRGRPSLPKATFDEEVDPAPKTKRGRPSLTKETADAAAPKRRRGRPSLEEQPQARSSQGSPPAEKGRRRRSDGPSGITESYVRSGRQPASESSTAVDTGRRGKKTQATARPRQAESSSLRENAEGEDVAAEPGSVLLEPTERSISRTTIAQRWAPLDSGAISAVAALLTAVELPVVVRVSAGQREQARSVLSIVSRRLRSKLVKGMPFPPASAPSRSTASGPKSGHEEDLDFERVVDAAQALEEQLDPLLHSVTLLKREVEKEEKLLEKDYAELRTLETNARAEARTWRERLKKSHPLAPDVNKEEAEPAPGSHEPDTLHEAEATPGTIFQVRWQPLNMTDGW